MRGLSILQYRDEAGRRWLRLDWLGMGKAGEGAAVGIRRAGCDFGFGRQGEGGLLIALLGESVRSR